MHARINARLNEIGGSKIKVDLPARSVFVSYNVVQGELQILGVRDMRGMRINPSNDELILIADEIRKI